MRKEILDWLTYDRQYSSGMQLYFRYGKNRVLLQRLNLSKETKQLYQELVEEFRNMIGMSIAELNKILSAPVKLKIEQSSTPDSEKKKSPETTKKIPVPENNGQKLRDEFPFLNDPKCPDELKVLVSDKMTTYFNFLAGREKLFTAKTKAEEFEAAGLTVESWMENQAIYKELDHYKKHHEILGKHKFFDRYKRLQELNAMTTEDLCTLRDNIEHSIWRNEKLIADNKKPDLKQKRVEKIEDYKFELNQVNDIIQNRK